MLEVRYSAAAREDILSLKARAAAAPQSKHAALWSQLKKILTEVLPVEALAFGQRTPLGKDLRRIRRQKLGRLRIFYLASREHQRVIVLFIGYRKAGDKHDAYTEFDRHLKGGEFDDHFIELGIEKP